jgi:hypothetical protein
MYKWYQDAEICYVHINDVAEQSSWSDTAALLRKARWFTRGWTLQELLAPRHIKFYDRNWRFLGGRSTNKRGQSAASNLLFFLVAEITNIDLDVINKERPIDRVVVAERMSWAADRVTTRKEDLAYCLLGIFDVNMPLLYGEGRKAFSRLQVAIMEATDDLSVMAWDYGLNASYLQRYRMDCLAQEPSDFRDCHFLDYCFAIPLVAAASHYSMTNLGVHITLPVIDIPHTGGTALLAALTCTDRRAKNMTGSSRYHIAIVLCHSDGGHTNAPKFHRAPYQTRPMLIETTTFRSARPQPMYIGTIFCGNSNGGSVQGPYAVNGTELLLTERYPYFTKCIASKTDTVASRGKRVSFSLRTTGMPPEYSPPTSFILGLKFARGDAAIPGYGSFFVLVKYQTPAGFHHSPHLGVVSDFRLVAGDGYPSLTSFMLKDEAVEKAFLAPGRNSIALQIPGSPAAQHFYCRGLAGADPDLGNNYFEFCLDAD